MLRYLLFVMAALFSLPTLAADLPPLEGTAPAGKEKQAAQKELADFILPKDFKVELVAADPLVVNPVSLALDEKGRIYYGESHTYRWGAGGSPYAKPTNPIVRLDPRPDGTFQRVIVAEGFEDPVMGILVRDGKLWAASNNYLYQYDIDDAGHTSNRRELLVDRNKAWNPFGMFVLETGPDGLPYMSIGDHDTDIVGPSGQFKARRNSGNVVRMSFDATNVERLVHGLRVPYAFEYDPFGQLWLLSNGEGSPNRFLRVIEGVDYHFNRPNVGWAWLAGQHPLAPPCFELPGGANTQLLRYYGAAFPQSYQGDLFLVNWGRHGFPSPNHTIYRYSPDERGNIAKQEAWLTSSDPNFRPTAMLLAPDGNLLLADWYGRDDENDTTGRIWKVSYVGSESAGKAETLPPERWTTTAHAIAGLGSVNHTWREKATEQLLAKGSAAVTPLAEHAASAPNSLGAAGALWTLARIGTPEALSAIGSGAKHPDWHVRRLALRLLRRYQVPAADGIAKTLLNDAAPAVKLEAALARTAPADIRQGLLAALAAGAAADPYLRYEAAWHLAKNGDEQTIPTLLGSGTPEIRLASLIAIDVALLEGFSTSKSAEKALVDALRQPSSFDPELLLKLAEIHRESWLAEPLQAYAATPNLSKPLVVRAVALLRAVSPPGANNLGDQAAANLLATIRSGEVPLQTTDDMLLLLDLLPLEGPSEFALNKLGELIFRPEPRVRERAHALVRAFGAKAEGLVPILWKKLLTDGLSPEDKLELVTTLVAIGGQPDTKNWGALLDAKEPAIAREAVRSWRQFAGQPELVKLLVDRVPELLKRDPALAADLAIVLAALNVDSNVLAGLQLPASERDKAKLGEYALAHSAEGQRVARGRQVFIRASCAKCHTSEGAELKVGPPLAGIGRVQRPEYLVESILEPSKIIKTGFETETLETVDGLPLSGLVREQGDDLLIIESDNKTTRIAKDQIEPGSRQVQKKSLMPDGLEAQLSPDELTDLVAYLVSLR